MIKQLMKYLEYPTGFIIGYFVLKALYDSHANAMAGIYACLVDEDMITETLTYEDLLAKAKNNCKMDGIEGMHLTKANYFLVSGGAIGTIVVTAIY